MKKNKEIKLLIYIFNEWKSTLQRRARDNETMKRIISSFMTKYLKYWEISMEIGKEKTNSQ